MRARVCALLLLAACVVGAQRPAGLGDVVNVRFWSYPDYTRVVVELDRAVDLRGDARRLPADRKASRPERLYVDLEGVWVGNRYDTGVPVGDGLLQGIRIGQHTRSGIRVVVDLEHYERHRLVTLSHPDRLVIDVYGPRRDGRDPRRGGDRGRRRRGLRGGVAEPRRLLPPRSRRRRRPRELRRVVRLRR